MEAKVGSKRAGTDGLHSRAGAQRLEERHGKLWEKLVVMLRIKRSKRESKKSEKIFKKESSEGEN